MSNETPSPASSRARRVGQSRVGFGGAGEDGLGASDDGLGAIEDARRALEAAGSARGANEHRAHANSRGGRDGVDLAKQGFENLSGRRGAPARLKRPREVRAERERVVERVRLGVRRRARRRDAVDVDVVGGRRRRAGGGGVARVRLRETQPLQELVHRTPAVVEIHHRASVREAMAVPGSNHRRLETRVAQRATRLGEIPSLERASRGLGETRGGGGAARDAVRDLHGPRGCAED